MKRYPRWLVVLPAVLAFAIVIVCVSLQPRNAPGLDGYGPDPRMIAVVLFAWILGAVLALTTLYALLVRLPKPSEKSRRARVAAYHLGLWVVVGGVLAAPQILERSGLNEMRQTPEWKAPATIAEGSLTDVARAYAQARSETKNLALLNDQMKSAALDYFRVDVLKFLKAQGVSFAEPGQEGAWIDSIIVVLRARGDHKPQAALETVRWLMDEGSPLGFSLKSRASDFSRVEFYFSAYEDIDAPATRQLLDLLVAHGADTVGCKDTASCPVVYLAGKGMTAAVRYLLDQGADPNSVEPGGKDTALSAAIIGKSPQTVKMLLAAGAHVRFDAQENDIATACGPWYEPYIDESKAVVRVLHEANIHMSADDLARYQGTIYNDDQRACIKRFM